MIKDDEAAPGTKPVLTASDVRAALGLPPEAEPGSIFSPDNGPDADDLTPEMIADLVGRWPGDDDFAPAPETPSVEDSPLVQTQPQQREIAAHDDGHAIGEIEKALCIGSNGNVRSEVSHQFDKSKSYAEEVMNMSREDHLNHHIKELEEMVEVLIELNLEREKPGFRPVQWLSRFFGRR